LEKKELAKRINVSLATLYNWEKTKPELTNIIENGLKFENGFTENNEIQKFFNQLSEDEQEMYLSEIKARILRKKLN
jgi:DNA-binding XRE family transcriptional regulator